jgi:hypothetical protein
MSVIDLLWNYIGKFVYWTNKTQKIKSFTIYTNIKFWDFWWELIAILHFGNTKITDLLQKRKIVLFVCLFVCFVGDMGLGFHLRSLSLQNWCSTAWVTTPMYFALIVLEIASQNYLPGLEWIHHPPDVSLSNL